jgi:DNA-binding NarL/FixJ family response regulator
MECIKSIILIETQKQLIKNIKYKYSMENSTIINPFNVLSKREKEVLDLMLQGAQVKDISASLELKSNTISTFKKNILAKTGVKNNIELFKLAQEFKIV